MLLLSCGKKGGMSRSTAFLVIAFMAFVLLTVIATTDAQTTTSSSSNSTTTATTAKPKTTAKPVAKKKAPVWHTVIAFILVFGMLILLGLEIGAPEMVMFGTNVCFVAFRIITVADSVVGFANQSMLTVAILFPIAFSLERTGAIEPLRLMFEKLAVTRDGKTRSLAHIIFLIYTPLAGLSAFLNNTPIVAMFIPVIQRLAKQIGISPAKLLIPLSYAVIVGGTVTLIGTSTNLVVSGLAEKKDASLKLGIFSLARVGFPSMLAGILYLMVFTKRFLPDRLGVDTSVDRQREYLTCLVVKKQDDKDKDSGILVGKTVSESGIKNMKSMYLVRIEREDGTTVNAPGPETALCGGDRLIFTGAVNSMLGFTALRGLRVETESESHGPDLFHLKKDDILVEAVISPRSYLVGQTVRDSNFRSEFDAAIIAVHRHGARLKEKIGDIVLKGGDTLLIVSKKAFLDHANGTSNFALMSKVAGHSHVRRKRAPLAILIIVTAIVCAAATDVEFLELCFYALAALLLTNCINAQEALASIKLDVIITVAAGFGISTGIVKSGAAATAANLLLKAAEPAGLAGAYMMLYLITVIFTAVLTNNAAAAIMFPIGFEIAQRLDTDLRPILYILMMSASADFMTPTGYQTNLMVYGPGGYHFLDYFKFGAPLQLTLAIIAIGVIVRQEYWWIWSLGLFALMGIVLFLTRETEDKKVRGIEDGGEDSAIALNPSGEPISEVFAFHPDLGVDPEPVFVSSRASTAKIEAQASSTSSLELIPVVDGKQGQESEA